MLKRLWQYRNFVLDSIRNEMRIRFARSKLGGLWMIVNPLAQVAIYVVILSNVLAAKLSGIDNKYSYAIYLIAGLLAWSLFNEIVARSTNLFIERGELMKKVNFPRITLPSILVGASLLNNLLLFAAVAGIYLLLGHGFGLLIVWLVPLTFTVVALAVGIGLIAGVLNVFLRDIGQIMPIALQIWFWFTPIVYPETIIPESYRQILLLNPMYPIVRAYHSVLVYKVQPAVAEVAAVCAVALVLMALSLFLFRRASAEMVDVL